MVHSLLGLINLNVTRGSLDQAHILFKCNLNSYFLIRPSTNQFTHVFRKFTLMNEYLNISNEIETE